MSASPSTLTRLDGSRVVSVIPTAAPRAAITLSGAGHNYTSGADTGGHFLVEDVVPGSYVPPASGAVWDPKAEGELWRSLIFLPRSIAPRPTRFPLARADRHTRCPAPLRPRPPRQWRGARRNRRNRGWCQRAFGKPDGRHGCQRNIRVRHSRRRMAAHRYSQRC